MRTTLGLLLFFLSFYSFSQEVVPFDRASAVKAFNQACSQDLSLAMGLAAEKESGKTKAELESIASSSRAPDLLLPIVNDLFDSPELMGRTYTFFAFDNCVISNALSRPKIPISEIREKLRACEIQFPTMEVFDNLIACLDQVLIEAGN